MVSWMLHHWCPWRDLNPHSFESAPKTDVSAIPPHGHESAMLAKLKVVARYLYGRINPCTRTPAGTVLSSNSCWILAAVYSATVIHGWI